jgi:hypothetical protein
MHQPTTKLHAITSFDNASTSRKVKKTMRRTRIGNRGLVGAESDIIVAWLGRSDKAVNWTRVRLHQEQSSKHFV